MVSVALPSNPSADPLGIARSERDDWVEMKLCKNFMRDTRQSMLGSLAASWIMAGVLYNSTPVLHLLCWVILLTLVIVFR